jgi:hypothetical protein
VEVQAADRDEVTDVSDILRKYGGSGSSSNGDGLKPAAAAKSSPKQPRPAASGGMGTGLFLILSLNFALFAASNLLHLPALANLTLNHWRPQWWQVRGGLWPRPHGAC